MIRVLQFADIVNRFDFIDTIVQGADPRRFQVGVCVRNPLSNICKPVYEERTPRWLLLGLSRWSIPHSAWQLSQLLRRWRADILHTHHFDQAVIGWLATRWYRKTRLVVGRHYSDALYRLTRGLKHQAFLGLEQRVNHAAVRIIVPSAYIRDILTQRQHIDSRKVDLVPYGFLPEKYTPPDASDLDLLRQKLMLNGQLLLGSFGRLDKEKGFQYLIEAMALLRDRLPHAQLLIAGEGPGRPFLERQIAEARLENRVRLLGWRRDALTLMAAVDIIVQPTLQEAFSQVMAEALWMGTPLIMSDVSGAPDVISDGINGLLVPRANTEALASAIERLARDSCLRERLGRAGRAYVEKHLAIRSVIPQYERVYERAPGVLDGFAESSPGKPIPTRSLSDHSRHSPSQ